MYYLYVRGKAYKHDGDHWMLLGIFPGSNYWSQCVTEAQSKYGVANITYRWHQRSN